MKRYFLKLVWDRAAMTAKDYNKVKVYNRVKYQRLT
jgi:hypothetical protein